MKRNVIPDNIVEYFDYVAPKDYKKESGLIWKKCNSLRKFVGKNAGHNQYFESTGNSYWMVGFNNNLYSAHNIIWMIHNGTIPDNMSIDHVDNNSLNNNLSNLKLKTLSCQNLNRRKSKDGNNNFIGVSWSVCCNKWLVQSTKNRKHTYLGVYNDEIVALKVRIKHMVENFNYDDYKNELLIVKLYDNNLYLEIIKEFNIKEIL